MHLRFFINLDIIKYINSNNSARERTHGHIRARNNCCYKGETHGIKCNLRLPDAGPAEGDRHPTEGGPPQRAHSPLGPAWRTVRPERCETLRRQHDGGGHGQSGRPGHRDRADEVGESPIYHRDQRRYRAAGR